MISDPSQELRPFRARYFTFNWKFGLALIILICIPRFLLVLKANADGDYGIIGAIMTLSAIATFIFLKRTGRVKIGMIGASKYKVLVIAFLAGLIASLVLYLFGELFYGSSIKNWYVYIGKSYKIPVGINGSEKMTMFAIMALVGMSFSPLGEEFFFRGIIHASFAKSIGEKKASIVDSSFFASTHVAHFGLVFISGYFHFYLIPTLIWVVAMFLTSMLFYHFKESTGSLLGAVICHSGFNLGMIFSIFYLL